MGVIMIKKYNHNGQYSLMIYFLPNLLVVAPLAWLVCSLCTGSGILWGLLFLFVVVFATNYFTYLIADKPGVYYVTDGAILDNKKESVVSFDRIESVVLTIGYNGGFVRYAELMRFFSPYARIKNDENSIEYLPKISLYSCAKQEIQHEDEMHDYPEEVGLEWKTIPFSREPVRTILGQTECTILVTNSFLLYNQWTVDKFANEYHVNAERIKLIKDEMKK